MAISTTDPLLAKQSWLFQQIGLDKIFEEYKGTGVKIGIYDDGLQANHSDLAGNYDASLEVKIGGAKVSPGVGTHGTAVAGIIAAVGNNGKGGVGIASEAKIAGVNMFSGATAGAGMVEAIKQMANFDVTNSSWNWTSKYADAITGSFGKQFQAAIDYAVDNGRGGLGTVIVNSAGNDWLTDRRDANTSGFDQTRETITVGAIADNGIVASYSNRGANILVSAPSSGGSKGVSTTDIEGSGGYSTGDSYDYFGGTSAAAPVVTGVAALMLDANPNLGWRDVKEILAMSADHTGSALGAAKTGNEAFGWSTNGATEFNGGGMHFSNDYGFGRVDAYTAVRMAEVWSLFQAAQTSANERTASVSGAVNKAIVDSGVQSFTINVTNQMRLEHVDLQLTLTHPNVNQLQVELISPDGTKSIMLTPGTGTAVSANNWTWTFGSEQFLGGLAAGTWTVKITDTVAGGSGTVASYKMDIYGSDADANNVYHYTDEFAKMLANNSARGTLNDTNGGNDWIDAAGIAQNITLDLNQGKTSKVGTANFITIGATAVIENAVTGDGNDTIIGNAVANALHGMRGNDTLDGGAGADTLNGGEGVDTATYARSTAGVTVDLTATTQIGGEAQGDKLTSIENLVGSAYADTLRGDAGANSLNGGAGNDVLEGRGGADAIDGGAGIDIVSYENSTVGVTVNAATGVVTGGDAQGDVLLNIEGYRGSKGNDWFFGSAGNDYFEGMAGNDTFRGSLGVDTLIGGDGIDTLDYSTSTARVLVNVSTNVVSSGDAQGDKISGIENVTGSAFDDVLIGGAGANVLIGGAGADRLDGGAGADTLNGGDGQDIADYATSTAGVNVNLTTGVGTGGYAQGDILTNIEQLQGSAYADIFTGTSSRNVIWAGAGNDTIDGNGGGDVVNAGAGNDLLIAGDAGNNAYNGEAGIDTITYADSALGITANLVTRVVTSSGTFVDVLSGFENIIGTKFNDTITGDTLDNRIEGGAGNDILAGGTGKDVFAFSSFNFGNDKISDFVRGTDKISLSGLGLTFADLTLTNSGGACVIDCDGAGIITLAGVNALQMNASDFLFI